MKNKQILFPQLYSNLEIQNDKRERNFKAYNTFSEEKDHSLTFHANNAMKTKINPIVKWNECNLVDN